MASERVKLRTPLSKASPIAVGPVAEAASALFVDCTRGRPLAQHLERRAELGPDLVTSSSSRRCSAADSRVIRRDVRMGFLDDQIRFAPRLLLHLLSGTLGGDERRTEERLELAMLRNVGLQFLQASRKAVALARDFPEAVGDLLEELVDASRRYPRSHARWRTTFLISVGVIDIRSPTSHRERTDETVCLAAERTAP